MNASSGYRVPIANSEQPHQHLDIIKGSRFIARIAFVEDVVAAKAFIKALNQTEPEATHHCWAYIVGNPNSTTLLACSDDGEPSGTAGMPMLNVLKHSGLGDLVAVVTRYYGGTKLGTGGLARAYGGAVKNALETISTEARIYTQKLIIKTSYDLQPQVQYLLEQVSAKIIDSDFGQKVAIQALVPQDQLSQLLASLEAYQQKNQLKVTQCKP